jgi:hypothetical protein
VTTTSYRRRLHAFIIGMQAPSDSSFRGGFIFDSG